MRKRVAIYSNRLKRNHISIWQAVWYNVHYYLFKNKSILVAGYLQTKNFGDWINNYLIEVISGKKIVDYDALLFQKNKKHLLAIGSIVHRANQDSVIWGSGLIKSDIKLKNAPAKICSVRGPKTRQLLLNQEIECPKVCGDPALLLPKYYTPKIPKVKTYKYGIIPHYVDKEFASKLCANLDGSSIILNIECGNKWREFIDQMHLCENILSSSLHGVIVADAYNIPNAWIEFSNKVVGDGFKFYDYFLSVGKCEQKRLDILNTNEFSEINKVLSAWKAPEFSAEAILQAFPYIL